VLQCVEVCCSALQCVAVCCRREPFADSGGILCVAAAMLCVLQLQHFVCCCIVQCVLQLVAMRFSFVQCIAVCCSFFGSLLQCILVLCSVLHCVLQLFALCFSFL